MDGATISALAALTGSIIGGLTALGTSRLTQEVQARARENAEDRTARQALYSDFNIPAAPAPAVPHPVVSPVPAPHSIEDLERPPVLGDLRATHSHKSRAAALLGLTRFQLYTRLERHNIDIVPD
jgi:DNA-binding NtrC family response regulator